tara:strand:+ start:946 stop:1131 length:186 start_codon:yes stop_codon:yes gene_type:complete
MNDVVDFLTLRNMQYNYFEFLKSYGTQEKTLEAMARIYPNDLIPALEAWLQDTQIPFEGGE